MISAEFGGTVRAGRYALEFPPGALNEDTEITIEPDSDGTLGVELLPHGIQFNKPVILRMDLRGTTAEGMGDRCSTLWFNENAGWWERMTMDPAGSHDSAAELWHFSGYKSDLNP